MKYLTFRNWFQNANLQSIYICKSTIKSAIKTSVHDPVTWRAYILKELFSGD